MNKLLELISLCKASVTLTVNDHKDHYETVAEYVQARIDLSGGTDEKTDAETLREMIARDTIVELHFYPNTPIGFYEVWHYDVEKCIEEALEIVKRNNGVRA